MSPSNYARPAEPDDERKTAADKPAPFGAVAANGAGRLGPFAVVPGLGIVATSAALPIDDAALAAWRRR